MTAADKHLYDTDLLDVLSQRVMVGDGAMGTQLQAADLTLDDFRGLEGCNEILNETRPDVLETIHRNYFEAGADAVETNTFGCNLSNLGDYDIADRIRDLSQKGTAIARRVADELGSPDRKRYVLGSMGPGTKLPTLGHTEYAVIRDAYTEAALGMLDGGADAILVVDIILSNNGYEVVNIGIKQPIATILEVAEDKSADVVGMSGLLVKSTVVMKENLEEMNTRGVAEKFPVLLGGAALTRSYVENDLAEIYQGEVHYARDAFEGLKLMDTIMSAKRGEAPDENSPEAIKAREKEAERKARHQRSKRIAAQRKAAEEPVEVPERSDVAADIEVPAPPFWGSRIVKGLAVADYTGLLDERALFLGQWGLRGQRGGEGPSYEDLVETEGRPRLRYWLDRLSTDGILAHAAVVYGYFPAVSEGNDIVVLTEPKPDAPVRYRFHFPRQQRGRFLCIADFIRSRELAAERGEVDVLPFQLVTMGQPIADFANELFASNAYRDYLEVHGIGVQLTEALAEYWHRRIREELKFSGDRAMAAEDPEAKEDYFKLGYRGARFAFGYGACPDLEDRAKMMALLEPERIGVTLSEELQLHPEQSTDAFVLHHPEAKYFNV